MYLILLTLYSTASKVYSVIKVYTLYLIVVECSLQTDNQLIERHSEHENMSYPEIPDISRLSVDTRGAEIVDDITEVSGLWWNLPKSKVWY